MSQTAVEASSRAAATGAVRAARRGASPRIVGVGTAVPANRWRQEDLAAVQGDLWGLRGAQLDRWRRLVERSGVEHRAIVDDPHDLPGLSTARRMDRFEAHAPGLAADAAARALAAAGIDGAAVTDLVVATCTGFSAPGIGASLIGGRVGVRREVRPLQLGFMGCFGGVAALRTARAIAGDDPEAVVLGLCVELCSLHLRASVEPQNLVASALFADGAAAVVVRGGAESGEGRGLALGRGRSASLPEHREEMTWRITDEGFAMTLSREVPLAIRRSLGGFLAARRPRPRTVLPHPGGPGILDAVASAIEGSPLAGSLDPRGIDLARGVLRDHGNMSSATILFVLERALAAGVAMPAELVAFGPGLMIDAILAGDAGRGARATRTIEP